MLNGRDFIHAWREQFTFAFPACTLVYHASRICRMLEALNQRGTEEPNVFPPFEAHARQLRGQ